MKTALVRGSALFNRLFERLRPFRRSPAPTESAQLHEFKPSKTFWVFISATREPRHLTDIVVAVMALRQTGVPDANVLVFTDHPAPRGYLSQHQISQVYGLNELRSRLADVEARYVVATCGGHGSRAGLQADSTTISPTELFEAVRSVRGAETAVVLLAQCYAGVFNYVDATAGRPNLVVLGSAMFYPTLSIPVRSTSGGRIKEASKLRPWSANVYQFNFFEWLACPVDVDGDGRCSLVDAYKYAAVRTVEDLSKVWIQMLIDLPKRQSAYDRAIAEGRSLLETEALRMLVRQAAEVLYYIQEPWLLNARLASRIVFMVP